MATAKGVRFATLKLPTPGSGLDDEDRYAIGGTVLSADSISDPGNTFDAFRMSVSGMSNLKPGTQDVAWRASLVNADWPTQGGSSFTATKRYYLAGAVMLPDGSITQNDRQAIGGVYPTNEESESFFDVFTLDYTLTPTSVLGGESAVFAGEIDAVLNTIISSLTGIGFDSFLPDDPGKGTGTTEVPINYNLDDHSGFKLFRDKGYTDGYGRFTVMGDPRHPIDTTRVGRNAPQKGPVSPEPDDAFISGDIDPDDL